MMLNTFATCGSKIHLLHFREHRWKRNERKRSGDAQKLYGRWFIYIYFPDRSVELVGVVVQRTKGRRFDPWPAYCISHCPWAPHWILKQLLKLRQGCKNVYGWLFCHQWCKVKLLWEVIEEQTYLPFRCVYVNPIKAFTAFYTAWSFRSNVHVQRCVK